MMAILRGVFLLGATAAIGCATVRVGDATDPDSLVRDGYCGEHFDVMVSCLALRTGAAHEA